VLLFFAFHFVAIKPPVADVDRSGAVDLTDTILAVQGLHKLSQSELFEEGGSTGNLRVYLLNAVESLNVVAGLKSFTPVKPAKTISAGASFVALLPTISVVDELPMTLVSDTLDPVYKSIAPQPSTPPPRA